MQTTDDKQTLLHKRGRFVAQYNALINTKPEEAALFQRGIENIDKQLAELEKKNAHTSPSEQAVEPEKVEAVPPQKGSLLGGLKAMVDYAPSNDPQSVKEVIQVEKKAAGLDEKK